MRIVTPIWTLSADRAPSRLGPAYAARAYVAVDEDIAPPMSGDADILDPSGQAIGNTAYDKTLAVRACDETSFVI